MKYCHDYGRIFKVHDGPFSAIIVVTDPKFMEYILSSPKHIDKAAQYTYLENWLGTGLLTSTGKNGKFLVNLMTHL